jgi:hypothetical protein
MMFDVRLTAWMRWLGQEKDTLTMVLARELIALKSMRDSGQDRDDIEHLRSILDEE